MQHYIDTATQELFAFEIGTDPSFIPTNLIKCDPRPSPYHTYDKNLGWQLSAKDKAKQSQDNVAAIRAQRNALLAASDWSMMSDTPTALSKPILAYRKALRNVMQAKDPQGALDACKAKIPKALQ